MLYVDGTCQWGLCNIGYPSVTHLKQKSRETAFALNIRFDCPIVLESCTVHGIDTAVLLSLYKMSTCLGDCEQSCRKTIFYAICFVPISHIVQGLNWLSPDNQLCEWCCRSHYRKTSSISRTKFQNWNVSRLVLQLSLLSALNSGVMLRMKM